MGRTSDKAVKFRKPKADPDAPKPAKRSEHGGMSYLPRQVLYHKKLGFGAKIVASFLYDHCAPGGNEATGSLAFMAAELNCAENTVHKAIRELFANHVIMSITKNPNGSGGFFNVYTMRTYDYPKLRDASKVLSMEKKLNKSEKVARDLKKKIEKGLIGNDDAPPVSCDLCGGTGWEYSQERRASRPCPKCRNRSEGEKAHLKK